MLAAPEAAARAGVSYSASVGATLLGSAACPFDEGALSAEGRQGFGIEKEVGVGALIEMPFSSSFPRFGTSASVAFFSRAVIAL